MSEIREAESLESGSVAERDCCAGRGKGDEKSAADATAAAAASTVAAARTLNQRPVAEPTRLRRHRATGSEAAERARTGADLAPGHR